MRRFLLTADVVRSRPIGKGVTDPWRLTLSDGRLTHDAAFNYVDEREIIKDLGEGRKELRFVDSYRYNIAAYELAELLGLADMIPVTVKRRYKARAGALSWWIDAKWDENERRKQGARPPDLDAWNAQIFRARVFFQLVQDTDPNQTNMLITEEWKIWIIDFTRAFRLKREIASLGALRKCDRRLFERLQQLQEAELANKVGNSLSEGETEAVMVRRDLIVEHIKKLIEVLGEDRVLY